MLIQQQPPTVKQKQIIKQDTTKKLFDEIDQEASRLIEEQRKKNVQKTKEELTILQKNYRHKKSRN